MTSTREPNPVELRDVGRCLNSQFLAITGKIDQQHLFSPSVGVWGKIYFCCCYRNNRFFPLQWQQTCQASLCASNEDTGVFYAFVKRRSYHRTSCFNDARPPRYRDPNMCKQ
ncbi:hypothetical protein TNCV_3256071 [Trichonephila clavipes]|nr:hypothetical protein TNCV_3256071 [Trichonephila clavipes]